MSARLAFAELRRTSARTSARSRTVLFAACAMLAASAAHAAPITVPNGDFSNPANFGTIGGGLLGASGTEVPIGDGPWVGSYNGILGLLAPPTLTISDGQATVSGIAAVNILGILDNAGSFIQTIPGTEFDAGERYTLTAEVDTGTLLDVSLLANGNLGAAFWSGDTMLASTQSAPPQLIDLQPLGGTVYQLVLQFDPSATMPGPISLQLFAEPEQLIGASLFPQVTYRRATLDKTAIDPVAGTIVAVDAVPQVAVVGEAFTDPLQVMVTDANGDPIANALVTFTAPATGASADLSATTVTTGSDGLASITAIAGTVAGTYMVTATVDGVDTPAVFNLTNAAGDAATTIGASGLVQSAIVGQPFPEPLVVLVTDAHGNPVAGTPVTFTAPDSGASAVLSDTMVMTDENGLASVTATANDVVGSYEVTASVAGVDTPAVFAFENRAADDTGTTLTGGSGNDQSANIGGAFECALTVTVLDVNGLPLAGYAIDFAAPDTGASAMLSNGVVSGTTVRVTTDAEGIATVAATANDVAGDYTITASPVGSNIAPVDFDLSNIEGLLFTNSFDTTCSMPVF